MHPYVFESESKKRRKNDIVNAIQCSTMTFTTMEKTTIDIEKTMSAREKRGRTEKRHKNGKIERKKRVKKKREIESQRNDNDK